MEQETKIIHLPQQFTSFVGREQELSEVSQLLTDPACRLLTLIGPGGIGKTRLALEATAVNAHHFSHGAAFVNLQPVYEANVLLTTIADTLGLSLSGPEEPLVQLCHQLAHKRLLLTLDNFEQLLDSTELISTLLQQTAVSLLITSREPLSINEEWLFPVRGLSLVDNNAAAVQLFADRASRIQPKFVLAAELPHVITICQLVEGLPLAIELAAAWVRSLSCAGIVVEMQQSLDFLSTRLRNVPERHRSIQAVFEQSWQHLTEVEQIVFQRLSVFRGGFRREAATAVAEATLPILSSLIDKSLLRWESEKEHEGSYGRYQIHELLRQYAHDKLQKITSEQEIAVAKHGNYYAEFLSTRVNITFPSRQQSHTTNEVEAELENVRGAWQWALSQQDVDAIYKISTSLNGFFHYRGRFLESMRVINTTLTVLTPMADQPLAQRCLALNYIDKAWTHIIFGQLDEAEQCARRVQELYAQLGILPLPGQATDPRLPLGAIALIRGFYDEAIHLSQGVLTIPAGDAIPLNVIFGHYHLAEALMGKGVYDQAQVQAQQAHDMAIAYHEEWFTAYCLNTLGHIARSQDDLATAKAHYVESYRLRELFMDDQGMAVAQTYLARIAIQEQDYQTAQQLFESSLTLYEQHTHDRGGIAMVRHGLGQTAVYRNDLATASQQFQAALKIACDIEYMPLLHDIFITLGELLGRVADLALATDLLSFVAQHPQSRAAAKVQAQAVLARVGKTAVSPIPPLDDLLPTITQAFITLPDSAPTSTSPPSTTAQPLVDPLTPRELEVLQLIADGHTNQQIADQLIISLGTVKYYTSHIYGKLGVSHRTQAVAHARDIGLI